MADIVLKDRNGRDVQYPGVNYLKVNTVDGGTQGFAAYDPETLTAENIKNGVTVGDVEGALSVPDKEERTIELDFSQGNTMVVTPSNNNELLFEESDVAFAPNPDADNVCMTMDASGFVFEVGSEYQVYWDGTAFDCVAYDASAIDPGFVAVGNGTIFGLQGNDEPFAFATAPIDSSYMMMLCSLLDTAESTHDVKIYKKIVGGGNEKVFTKVNINKPANLVPGNIAKDVDIAGVVGTAESGGGANIRPAMLVYVETQAIFTRNTGTRKFSFFKQVLPEVTVIEAFGSGASHSIASTSSASTNSTTIRPTGKIGTYEMSESGDYVKIAGSISQNYSVSYNVPFATWGILFHLQGLYIRNIDKDNFELYADETFVSSLSNTMVAEKFVSVDFSGVMRTKLSTGDVPLSTIFKRFVVPATIESIPLGIFNNCAGLEEIDFSKCTSVPTTASVSLPTGVSENLQIKVPAALYDEWIAATNWSSFASYIVPV